MCWQVQNSCFLDPEVFRVKKDLRPICVLWSKCCCIRAWCFMLSGVVWAETFMFECGFGLGLNFSSLCSSKTCELFLSLSHFAPKRMSFPLPAKQVHWLLNWLRSQLIHGDEFSSPLCCVIVCKLMFLFLFHESFRANVRFEMALHVCFVLCARSSGWITNCIRVGKKATTKKSTQTSKRKFFPKNPQKIRMTISR